MAVNQQEGVDKRVVSMGLCAEGRIAPPRLVSAKGRSIEEGSKLENGAIGYIAQRMDAEGLKEGIGYMPMDGTKKKSVDWIDTRRTLIGSTRRRLSLGRQENLSLGRQQMKEEPIDWIDDAGWSLELADEQ